MNLTSFTPCDVIGGDRLNVACIDWANNLETEAILLEVAIDLLIESPVDALPIDKLIFLLQSHSDNLSDRLDELKAIAAGGDHR